MEREINEKWQFRENIFFLLIGYHDLLDTKLTRCSKRLKQCLRFKCYSLLCLVLHNKCSVILEGRWQCDQMAKIFVQSLAVYKQ